MARCFQIGVNAIFFSYIRSFSILHSWSVCIPLRSLFFFVCVCGPSPSALNNPQQQQIKFVIQWVGRARLALSFVSGCPGRGVPAFLGCDLRVRAQLSGWWLCDHVGPSFVILEYPVPVGGSNRVHPIYTLYARQRCTSVVIFVQSIMLMFASSYLMFKTIAEHTADIVSEYKLTHRKVGEFTAESPDITTPTQISRNIREQWFTGFI